MKKLFTILTLSLLISMQSSNVRANYHHGDPDKKEDVDMREKSSNPVRSLIILPEVCRYESGNTITISFNDANAMYSVLIYDIDGFCVMSDIFIANGITQTYGISSLGSGLHTIVIVNNYREFEGEFINLN